MTPVIMVDGKDVMPEVRAHPCPDAGLCRATCATGRFKGQGGQITDVVNIGIGGSDLGPAMATLALAPYADGPRCHFVSNVDGAHIHDMLRGLNPETTLVIVASKTFTTIETMTNADTAKRWMAAKVANPAAQFAAVSHRRRQDRGLSALIPRASSGSRTGSAGAIRCGGRSGCALMIADRARGFRPTSLPAARRWTTISATAPLRAEPARAAGAGRHLAQPDLRPCARAPCCPMTSGLLRLPAYLQQLEMESNGKRVAMDGSDLTMNSGPVVWGEPGTNGQHAFYQLIHQGTRVIPCEFLVARQGHEPDLAHQHLLLVVELPRAVRGADARPLAWTRRRRSWRRKGLTGAELDRQARHRVFPGNRPSTTLAYRLLTPFTLGQIIALYEHRVFVEGVILGINCFDQWGVELGKELALALAADPRRERRRRGQGRLHRGSSSTYLQELSVSPIFCSQISHGGAGV